MISSKHGTTWKGKWQWHKGLVSAPTNKILERYQKIDNFAFNKKNHYGPRKKYALLKKMECCLKLKIVFWHLVLILGAKMGNLPKRLSERTWCVKWLFFEVIQQIPSVAIVPLLVSILPIFLQHAKEWWRDILTNTPPTIKQNTLWMLDCCWILFLMFNKPLLFNMKNTLREKPCIFQSKLWNLPVTYFN